MEKQLAEAIAAEMARSKVFEKALKEHLKRQTK